MIYEILNPQGQVINTIVADWDFIASNYPDGNYREVPEVPAPEPEPVVYTKMTKLAFRNRFTAAEKVAIEIACLDDPTAAMAQRQQSAMLRASQNDVAAATFIDPQRQDTRDGVLALETVGILAAGRALQILDAVITEEEAYKQ